MAVQGRALDAVVDNQRGAAFSREGPRARHHLLGEDAQGEDVAGRADGSRERLLGAGVAHRAHEGADAREGTARAGAGGRARSALAYDPVANHWRRLAPPPVGRVDSEAKWTGRRLLVWGSLETASSASPVALAYDPGTDRWLRLAGSPLHGFAQAVVWTGHELLVWGGVVPTLAGTNAPVRYLDTGAAFTPTPERSAS